MIRLVLAEDLSENYHGYVLLVSFVVLIYIAYDM